MKTIFSVCLLSFLLLIFSCSKDVISPLNYQKPMLVLGMGGGFTGAFSEYYLLENGQLFRSGSSDTTFSQIGKLAIEETEQLFSTYDILRFDELHLDEPGNRYFYIKRKSGSKESKLLWGHKELDNNAPAIFHKNFMNKIQNLQNENTNKIK